MVPLRMSYPQILPKTARFLVVDKLDVARRNIPCTQSFTRLLSCKHCGMPFCTDVQISTGIQIIKQVFALENSPYADAFLVRQATNLRLSETIDTVATAQLHSKMCLVVQTIFCQQCNFLAGYKVIAIEGVEKVNANSSTNNANQITIGSNDEIAIGQYILFVRFLDIP